MRRPDPRQMSLLDFVADQPAERKRWHPLDAFEEIERRVTAFHETAVAGNRPEQDIAISRMNRFIGECFEDSAGWNARAVFPDSYALRVWLLRATEHSPGEPLKLGQAFSLPAVLDGEDVRVVCGGLASVRVTVHAAAGKPDRAYWAGLGMTGFHALNGRTPLEYIVSRCVPEHAA